VRGPLGLDPIVASMPVVATLGRALSALDPARVPWIRASKGFDDVPVLLLLLELILLLILKKTAVLRSSG